MNLQRIGIHEETNCYINIYAERSGLCKTVALFRKNYRMIKTKKF